MSLKGFLKECNKREVFKLLSIYIVSSWVILQVLSVIWQPLGMPEKSVTFLIIFLLIGFPLYIYLLWKSRVRHVISEDESEDVERNIKNEIGFKRMYFTALGLIGILSVVTVILIINNTFFKNLNLPSFNASDKIAVLNFENNTGDESLDLVGKMTADWLIHGITENHAGEVISSDVVSSYSSILGVQASPLENTNILDNFLKPNKIISGSYFLNENTLVLRCSIEDRTGLKTVFAFSPVECDKDNSLACIEDLRQEIVGYLVTKDSPELNLQEDPPKFEAYQKVEDAIENYSDPETYLKMLNEAIALDSTYFYPEFLRSQHYYNEGNYKLVDSLNKVMAARERLNKRQQYLLNYSKALLKGENNKIYLNFKYEYDIAPSHLATNSTGMVLMMQYLNKPEKVEKIFEVIPMKDMDLQNCDHCIYRYLMMAVANNELKKYQETIDLLTPVIAIRDDYFLHRALFTAYIRSGKTTELTKDLSKLELIGNYENLNSLYLWIGREYLLQNNTESAVAYFDKIINAPNANDIDLANAFYYKEDYISAENAFQKLYNEDPQVIGTISKLAVCLNKNGKIKEGEELILSLEQFRTEYEYGKIDYGLAQYYAATEQKDLAMKCLLKSVAKGHLYRNDTFQNDTHFIKYKDLPVFKEILNFWEVE